jgi:hypothetical protein
MPPDLQTPELVAGPRWVRSPRTSSATRTDGLVLVYKDGAWLLASGGAESLVLTSPDTVEYMEEAIFLADVLNPPAPWVCEGASWCADVWCVSPEAEGWIVYRAFEEGLRRASTQVFTSPDRARRWAELRFDRGQSGLRGPKPRAGTKARAKLPDVRVTQGEREHTLAMLERIGIPYSTFVRAASAWVEAHLTGDNPSWAIDTTLDQFVPLVKD